MLDVDPIQPIACGLNDTSGVADLPFRAAAALRPLQLGHDHVLGGRHPGRDAPENGLLATLELCP